MQQIVSHPQSYCVTRMASSSASSSATSERFSKEQAQKSGTETEEYKNVNQNMAKIIKAINTNPGALKTLTRQFMTHKWLDAQLDPKDITTMMLIQLALNRIENDASQYNQFIKMLNNITGLDHILSSLYVKKEEMVSGKTDRSPTLLHSPKVKKKVTRLEPDSGYAAENTPPCPRSHPPGTIPNPSEIAAGFVPETSLQSDGSHGSPNDEFTGMPVPLSTAESVNVQPHQPKLDDVADYQPQSAMFTVGPGEIHRESESSGLLDPGVGTENGSNEQDTTSKPVQEISDEPQEALSETTAYMYLSSGMIARLKQLEEQKKKVEVLEKRLEEEIEAKNALQQERDELENTLEQYQEYATKEKGAAEEKIKEKEQELEKCKENMSVMKTDHQKEVARVESKKREMELEYNSVVAKLEEEIANLKKERDDKDQKTEVEMLRLENRLCKAEKQIIQKDYLILEQQMTILKLNKKITEESKDTEIQKLKRENRQLRKGKSLSHSLSDLKIDEEDS